MKVYTKKSILTIYLYIVVGGKIEKIGLELRIFKAWRKKYDSYQKKVVQGRSMYPFSKRKEKYEGPEEEYVFIMNHNNKFCYSSS